jgi:hypothetical protein
MILIRFGRWSHAAGRFFVWDRIYWKGWKWTPFCRVKRRHVKSQEFEDNMDYLRKLAKRRDDRCPSI